MKWVGSFWEGIAWAEQRKGVAHNDELYSFSRFLILPEVLHNFEVETDLQVHLIFKCLDNLLWNSCFLQIIIMHEDVWFICIHDYKTVVSTFIEKFESASEALVLTALSCLRVSRICAWSIVVLSLGRLGLRWKRFLRRHRVYWHLRIVHVVLWFVTIIRWLVVQVIHLLRTHYSLYTYICMIVVEIFSIGSALVDKLCIFP